MNPIVKRLLTWGTASVIAASAGIIASFEGRSNYAYPDPASPMAQAIRKDGMWEEILSGSDIPGKYLHLDGSPFTICDGITRGVKIGDRKTDEECDKLLEEETIRHHKVMRSCVKVPLTLWEEAAMTSFFYNFGGKACNYRVVRRLNEGASPSEWCDLILMYDNAGGKRLRGLTRRREAERNLCLGNSPWRVEPTTLKHFTVE